MYAREGYPISTRKAQIWRNASQNRQLRPILSALLHQTRVPQAGEIVHSPNLARTLQAIALGGGDAFYKGEIARQILAFSKQNGGLFEREDFEAHQSERREPLRITYRGYTVHGQPPVSPGIILMEALGILDGVPLKERSPADRTHWMLVAIKCAFAD